MDDILINDIVTYYFITSYDPNSRINKRYIQAYSDDKNLIDLYMEFHNCKRYKCKKVEKRYKEIIRMINDNASKELTLTNLVTRNKKGDVIDISIPMTIVECATLNDELKSYVSNIDYALINDMFHDLKPSYQDALDKIGLIDIIRSSIYNRNNSKFLKDLEFDQLVFFTKHFSEEFN